VCVLPHKLAAAFQLTLGLSRKNAPPEASIFECISMLATAVGQALTKHMHELLDLMFAFGLSQPLRLALVDLAHHIPPLLSTIQGGLLRCADMLPELTATADRLLDLISMILSGNPFRPPGAPRAINIVSARDLHNVRLCLYFFIELSFKQSVFQVESKSAATVTLALETLGDFDFTGNHCNSIPKKDSLELIRRTRPYTKRVCTRDGCPISRR
jgi:FKBP12-rapamycin complex-associated protein